MEPKKNPKVDVHTKRGIIFNFSLVLSLLVVITAFQWTAPIPHHDGRTEDPMTDSDIPYVPITDFNTTVEIPKPIALPQPLIIPPNPEFVIVKDLPGNEPATSIDLSPVDIPFISANPEPETFTDTTTFIFVETPPEPVGGMKGFYEGMKKNFKYPRRAISHNTEGKVFVEFTIEPTGAISNVKVMRGIGDGCDEEAKRVIGLSQWKAGKQRGRPVRVRMVQPVIFELQNKE